MQVIWCLKFFNMTKSGGQSPAPNSGGGGFVPPVPSPGDLRPCLSRCRRDGRNMECHRCRAVAARPTRHCRHSGLPRQTTFLFQRLSIPSSGGMRSLSGTQWWMSEFTFFWIGFCHTGLISLCVDLFVFICVYFVCFCFILHSCCIIVSTVGWTWWDWSLIFRTHLPSVLWHCWLGHLTRNNPSPIWPIMCLMGC